MILGVIGASGTRINKIDSVRGERARLKIILLVYLNANIRRIPIIALIKAQVARLSPSRFI
jgi:hypothetical protein